MKQKSIIFIALALLCSTSFAAMRVDYNIPCEGGEIQCTNLFGGEYELLAVPTPGTNYEFVCWEDNSTTNPRTVRPTGITNYHAVFAHNIHFEDGDVEVTPTNADAATFTLKAVGHCGQKLINWSDRTTNPIKTNYYPSSSNNGVALFPVFSAISHQDTPAAGGSITSAKQDCNFILTAVPNNGYMFQKWADNVTDNPRTVAYESGHTYQAIFMKGEPIAQMNNILYSSIDQAAHDAVTGDEITILGNSTENVVVPTGKEITLAGNGKNLTGEVKIEAGSAIELTSDYTISSLVLGAAGGQTGQLIGTDHLTCTQAAMEFTLEPGQQTASDQKWYVIGVPFAVDLTTGISVNGEARTYGEDVGVKSFDVTKRAQGQDPWTLLHGGELMAGHYYQMAISTDDNVWRFNSKGAIEANTIHLDAGWNATANALLQNAMGSVANVEYAQTYDYATGGWIVRYLPTTTFPVGAPMLIEAAQEETLALTPAAKPNEGTDASVLRYEIQLTQGVAMDALYITSHLDATNEYIVGRDVEKTMLTTVPQLYTTAYGKNLCVEDQPLVQDKAAYTTTFYAPTAGNYVLTANPASQDLSLYKDGQKQATLDEPYTLYLNAGVNSGYELRIAGHLTPTTLNHITTTKVAKFIRNGQFFIQHNEQLFDILGNQH